MEFVKEKKKAALLSIVSNSFLILAKFFVGFISGSVSIISEAIHSFTDLLASILAFYSIRESSKPADVDHPYGHGKFEDLSGGAEGILIILAAIYIIYEALEKIKHVNHEINASAGIIVMFISVVVNLIISSYLFRIAKKSDSIALLADAQHLRTDVYTSFGVLLGLVLIKLTDQHLFDPLVAIIVALFIIKAGYDLTKTAIKNLLDTSLPEEEKNIIMESINVYIPADIIKIQDFKTRKAGSRKVIEFALIVPTSMTIKEGHTICDKIEEDLENKLKNIDVTIHLEPCNGECSMCILYHKDSLACHRLKFKDR